MKKKQQKWRLISKIILLVILILVAICAISLARSKWGLTCSEYEITSAKITRDIRIVELAEPSDTDLTTITVDDLTDL